MQFFENLKSKFSKKDDRAIYLSGFKKTKSLFGNRLQEVEYTYQGVNDDFLEQLTIVLLESDVGIETADYICEKLKNRSRDFSFVPFSLVIDILLETMLNIYLDGGEETVHYATQGPTVILLEGVNGAGKTTTAAKLAKMFLKQGKKVALVAADTFRAGAIDQLILWADRLAIPCIKGIENGDPSAAIVDGCIFAKENHIDVLICDTAGRLQNKQGLMAQLTKMNRVAGKQIPDAPHNTWLVLDATTGQNGLSQAEIFAQATKLDGIILTKMDGTAKGGIVIAIKHKLNLPVLFVGLGEHEDDLRPFDIDSYLYSISEGIENAG